MTTPALAPTLEADQLTAEPAGPRMGRFRLVLLGWRMSVATSDGRRRLLVAGIGASLAMLVLLLGMGVVTARSAQQERIDGRTPTSVEGVVENGLAVVADQNGPFGRTWFRGIPVTVHKGVPIGTPPAPPGLAVFPQPGQIAASPAFAQLHASDPAFAARFPGEVVATVQGEGLAGPNEVLAWIAVEQAADTYDTCGYGLPEWQAEAEAGNRTTEDTVIPLGVLLFVLPVLILVGTATRLGSAQRDQRMAAMRLVGATPGEVRLVSAAEAGGIGAAGVVGGLALFLIVRPMVAWLPWRPGIFPHDLAPNPLLVVLLAGALPLLGMLAGLVSQRRVVTSPLGVTRRATPKPPHPRRLIPLGLGIACLLVLVVFPSLITAGQTALIYLLLLGGAGLTIVGLVVATPLVGAAAASAMLRIDRLPVAGQLAARRVQADPNAAARLVTGISVLVFIATWILASFLPVLTQASTGYLSEQYAQVQPGTVAGLSRLDTVDQLRATPGVRAVVPVLLTEATQASSEDDDWASAPGIGDCVAISAVLRTPLPDCTAGTAYAINAEPATDPILLVDPLDQRSIDVGRPTFDSVAKLGGDDGYALSAALRGLGVGSYLLPASNTPADVPVDWPVQMLVATDNDPGTVEAVKTIMAVSTGIVPATGEDQQREESSEQRLYSLLLLAYLAAIALIAVASLAVAAADDLRVRARSLAGLSAAGTPVATLRRASLLQLALTLVPAVATALGAATIAGWMYSELWLVDSTLGTPRPFHAGVIVAVGVSTIMIVLASYALSLPALRSAVDLRGMRTG